MHGFTCVFYSLHKNLDTVSFNDVCKLEDHIDYAQD